jgi:hypothetical protein
MRSVAKLCPLFPSLPLLVFVRLKGLPSGQAFIVWLKTGARLNSCVFALVLLFYKKKMKYH